MCADRDSFDVAARERGGMHPASGTDNWNMLVGNTFACSGHRYCGAGVERGGIAVRRVARCRQTPLEHSASSAQGPMLDGEDSRQRSRLPARCQ